MEEVTKEVCGAVAAQHRRQIETLLLQPVSELFLCPFDKSKFWLSLLCGRSEVRMRFCDRGWNLADLADLHGRSAEMSWKVYRFCCWDYYHTEFDQQK